MGAAVRVGHAFLIEDSEMKVLAGDFPIHLKEDGLAAHSLAGTKSDITPKLLGREHGTDEGFGLQGEVEIRCHRVIERHPSHTVDVGRAVNG